MTSSAVIVKLHLEACCSIVELELASVNAPDFAQQ